MSLRDVEVRTSPGYRVRIGPGALDGLAEALEGLGRAALLSDENVWQHQGARLAAWTGPRLSVPPGEDSKSFAGLEQVLDFLAAGDLDRSSVLVAFGGGVVGDLGGLAASLYMRGIDLVQCPTTLLSQVDSSVGGKTAVNLVGGKNLAGTFHQPRLVLADTNTLATLAHGEFLSGLGEVVKSALIGDPQLFELLENESEAVRRRDPGVLGSVVERCVRVKAGVVARDERESGERKTLNLGHTFAHAIEQTAGYGRVPHGVAVAVGLVLALETSLRSGRLEDAELPGRVERLLTALELPPSLGALRESAGLALTPDELSHGMRHDKKGRAGEPALVLVRSLGDTCFDQSVSGELLARILA